MKRNGLKCSEKAFMGAGAFMPLFRRVDDRLRAFRGRAFHGRYACGGIRVFGGGCVCGRKSFAGYVLIREKRSRKPVRKSFSRLISTHRYSIEKRLAVAALLCNLSEPRQKTPEFGMTQRPPINGIISDVCKCDIYRLSRCRLRLSPARSRMSWTE